MTDGERRDAERRVRALVEGAQRLADGTSELGRRARRELVATTGLSPENVELALCECLETRVADADVAKLCAGVAAAPAAHVLLSANVFVAAHRAVALALAASSRVQVRPSRREPAFARLLADAAPGLFELVTELAPEPNDVVFAYGADETLARVRASLPPDVAIHAHGSGIGVAVVDAPNATRAAARALALDVVPFDQRGCLSPRAALFVGESDDARAFATLVAEELAALAVRVPLGALTPDEAADITRFRDTFAYARDVLPAGPGWVATSPSAVFAVAPVGRNLAVTAAADPAALLRFHVRSIAALGLATTPALASSLRAALPGARPSPLGQMQRPPFDGPVDLRVPKPY